MLAGLEQPLALISDLQRRDEFQAYIHAARPHVERGIFDLLSQVVTAFNDASPDQKARLEYADGALHLAIEPGGSGEPAPTFDDSDLEKVTLRLPKELKDLIDSAAGRHGISANNWYVRELSRTIARQVRDGISEAFRGDPRDRGDRDPRRRGFYRGRGSSLRGTVGGDEPQE
jgi:hypothetical protein